MYQSDVTVFHSSSGAGTTISCWRKKMPNMVLPANLSCHAFIGGTTPSFNHAILWLLASWSQLQSQVSSPVTRFLNVESSPFWNFLRKWRQYLTRTPFWSCIGSRGTHQAEFLLCSSSLSKILEIDMAFIPSFSSSFPSVNRPSSFTVSFTAATISSWITVFFLPFTRIVSETETAILISPKPLTRYLWRWNLVTKYIFKLSSQREGSTRTKSHTGWTPKTVHLSLLENAVHHLQYRFSFSSPRLSVGYKFTVLRL